MITNLTIRRSDAGAATTTTSMLQLVHLASPSNMSATDDGATDAANVGAIGGGTPGGAASTGAGGSAPGGGATGSAATVAVDGDSLKKSLTALLRVVTALTSAAGSNNGSNGAGVGGTHIPFRDSVLTRLLKRGLTEGQSTLVATLRFVSGECTTKPIIARSLDPCKFTPSRSLFNQPISSDRMRQRARPLSSYALRRR